MLGRIGPGGVRAAPQLFDIVDMTRRDSRAAGFVIGMELLLNVDLVGLVFGG